MELREGYKNTEVGVIPVDWEIIQLSDIITEFRGGAPLKPRDFVKTGIKVIPKGGIGRTGWLQVGIDDYQYCSKEFANAHRNNQVDESYTLVVLRDLVPSGPSIGLTVQIREVDSFILAQGVYGFKVNELAYPQYLIQLSNTHWYRKLMNSIMVGSTQVHITNTAFKRIHIPLPKRHEQTAIATALSDADALINSLEKLIAKKRNIKQGAMQQLLKPKEGWEVKKLGESADIFRGGSPRPIENFITTRPNGINWIKIGDVGKGAKFIETTEEKIIQEGVSRSRFVNEGDFLLSNSMSFGRPYILKTNGCIHDGWLVIQNYQNHFDRDFLYYVLGSESILAQYKAMASGSSVLNLNKEIVKNVLVNCPVSIEEQTRIATILSDMDAEIQALETKLEKYRKIKLGMMQNLLTGKIRLV